MDDETIEELREAWQASRENNRRLAELQSRFTHLNSMLSELQRRKEPELARNCPVCGKPQHGVVLHGPGTTVYWHVDGTGDNCEGLPAQNAKLKERNEQLEHNKAYFARHALNISEAF